MYMKHINKYIWGDLTFCHKRVFCITQRKQVDYKSVLSILLTLSLRHPNHCSYQS